MGTQRQLALLAVAATGFFTLVAGIEASAQTQTQQREQVQKRTRAGQREIIPGSELMTARERDQYRQRMAAAPSDADRARLRSEHVKAMQERARLRGLELAEPSAAPAGGQK